MIRKNQRIINFFNIFLDAMIIFLSYILSVWLWLVVIQKDLGNLAISIIGEGGISIYIVFSCFTVMLYGVVGLYRPLRTKPIGFEIIRVILVNTVGVLGLGTILFFIRFTDFSRGVLGCFYIISTTLIILKKIFVHIILRYYRAKGYNLKHVVVVGDGILAKSYIDTINKTTRFGYEIVGYISKIDKSELGVRLGSYEQIDLVLSDPAIDEVVVALEGHEMHHMKTVLDECRKQGNRVSVIPFYNEFIPDKPSFDVIGTSKLIRVQTSPLDNIINSIIKRTTDIIFSSILIIITSPIMIFAWVGTAVTNKGSVIFKQERVGLNKHKFVMMKFRSMNVNSAENTAWTKDKDDRKTRFGSFLRKTSIDELPQFFNVLKGDMSLVGPRPEIPKYVEQFKEEIPLYMVKHQVRPGITGWAQVNGFRGDTSIEERIRHDIWYIENWSLALDIIIIFKTIFGGMINKEKIK